MEENKQKRHNFLYYLKTLLSGIAIGIANIIPGVSGGTFALILGIYDEFIGVFDSVLKCVTSFFVFLFGFKKKNWIKFVDVVKSINWLWVIILFLGIFLAIIISSSFITYVLEYFPAQTYGLFFGLIVASVVVPFSKMEKKGLSELIAFIIAFACMFSLNWIKPVEPKYNEIVDIKYEKSDKQIILSWNSDGNGTEYHIFRSDKKSNNIKDYIELKITKSSTYIDERIYPNKEYSYKVMSTFSNPAIWYMILAGIISASAMILPGLSGSYIMLIMGVYGHLISSLTSYSLINNTFESIITILVYAIGIAIGLLGFSRVLKLLLKKFQSITMGFLIGLMLGSLGAIYPFLDTYTSSYIDGMKADEIPKLFFWNMPFGLTLSDYFSKHFIDFISIIAFLIIGIAIVLVLYFTTRKLEKKTS